MVVCWFWWLWLFVSFCFYWFAIEFGVFLSSYRLYVIGFIDGLMIFTYPRESMVDLPALTHKLWHVMTQSTLVYHIYIYIHSLNSLHIDRSFAELITLFHAVLCSESACLASRVIALGRPFQVRCLLCLSLKQGVHHLDTYRVLPVALVQYPTAKGQ